MKLWQESARCRSEQPGAMHPDKATTEEVADALLVCVGCPVVEQCRDAAEGHEAYGVWAGLWWGELPVWEVARQCAHETCTESFRTEAAGNRSQSFCSPKCRVAAYRARSNLSA